MSDWRKSGGANGKPFPQPQIGVDGALGRDWRMDQAYDASNGYARVQPEEGEAPRLRKLLAEAQTKLAEQKKWIEGVASAPQMLGTVVKLIDNDSALVALDRGATLVLNRVDGLEPGKQVRTHQQTSQIIKVLPAPISFGATVPVVKVTTNGLAVDGVTGARFVTAASELGEVKAGDHVRLDPAGMVALTNLGPERTRFAVRDDQHVSWDDIGGCEDAKEALREAIEYPTLHADLYAKYGHAPSKGVLLYGPPGTGKTMLGKAAAHSIGSGEGFIYIKGAELLSKWVGESEGQVRSLFERARTYKRATGRSAVLFIDEADAILAARGGSLGAGMASAAMLVPTFLAEMDGLDESGAFVILSTNRHDTLDPAIVRDGRIDRKVRVGRPGRDACAEILRLNLKRTPTDGELETLVARTIDVLLSPELALYEASDGTRVELITYAHAMNGAIIAGIAKRATTLAIRRDRTAHSPKCSGVGAEDLIHAAHASFEEACALPNQDALIERLEELQITHGSLRKATYDARSKKAVFRGEHQPRGSEVLPPRNALN